MGRGGQLHGCITCTLCYGCAGAPADVLALVPWADVLSHSSEAGPGSCLRYSLELGVSTGGVIEAYIVDSPLYCMALCSQDTPQDCKGHCHRVTDHTSHVTGKQPSHITEHGSQNTDYKTWITKHGSQNMDNRTWITYTGGFTIMGQHPACAIQWSMGSTTHWGVDNKREAMLEGLTCGCEVLWPLPHIPLPLKECRFAP